MNLKYTGILSIVFALLLSACAKDKTQEDWQREKQSEEYAKIQAIAGVYVGKIDSSDGSKKIDVALELKAGTRVATSTGTSGTAQAATVQGRITLLNEQMASVAFEQGYFDTDTLELRAALEIIDRSGSKTTIQIAGKIDGDSFSGEIENQSYAETKRTLNLSKKSTESERAAVSRISQGLSGRASVENQVFEGTLKNAASNNKEEAGQLTITVPTATAEQLFLEEFSPVTVVDATLLTAVGEPASTRLYFPVSKIDARRGLLYGLRQTNTGALLTGVYLSCNQVADGWYCEYFANDIGKIYYGTLVRK